MIYVAVAVAVVSTLLWGAMHNVDASLLILPWWTLLVFGLAIGTYIGWIRSRRFWIVIAALLALHVITYTVAFTHGYPLQARWGWVLLFVEIALIDIALGYFGIRPRRPRR